MTDLSLTGHIAIVTGAGRGVGAQIAHELAAVGAAVCAADLNPDRANRIADEIVQAGGESFGWQADVSNKFQAAGMIETTRDRYGCLDMLVHCAHISPRGDLLTMDEWNWRKTTEVNITGAFLCAQLCARVMADEGGGTIALLADQPDPGGEMPAAAITQPAIAALAAELAAELASQSVNVFTFSHADGMQLVARLVSSLS